MTLYNKLIAENTAPRGARRIGVYDESGKRVGWIPLGHLTPPDQSAKEYSFGALSDVHFLSDTAQEDFRKALKYLTETENVAFTCIAGDMTDSGAANELAASKACVDANSPNTPVYVTPGNHECYAGTVFRDSWQQYIQMPDSYTGVFPFYYSFSHGDDVFIFMGVQNDWEGHLFYWNNKWEALQWLYETLEANRNKRCFLFEHVRPQDGCGNALGIYTYDIWGDSSSVKEATIFESLMRHYRNVILFHGHSHLRFYLQEYEEAYGTWANYDHHFGCHSVHIPSLTKPRDFTGSALNPSRVELTAESEGYVVDVYENGIHLRGRDFVKGEFLPIASYWLDTTIQTIAAGTYTDPTGTIVV
jgi:predicted phosphodiesterase